ncbi:MAG: efflux RND transporter permease subunit [Myxococcales bacterium]|nr:efflux RND transporter permease subunit [Myxococcales bacterium]
MGGLIRLSIQLPHTIFAATVLLVLFGILSIFEIPLQMRPSVDKPEITITTDYLGASPEEIEDKITRPIEEAVNAVEGVKKLSSTSVQGRSRITLEFDWDVNRNASMVDVLNKLGRVTRLPEEALAPVAEAISSDTSNPMMWIGFQAIGKEAKNPNLNRMRQLIDDVIEPRLRRVEGVGSLIISGGQEREVQIIVDLQRLAHHKIPLASMVSQIRRAHLTVRGGPMDTGKREYVVWTSGRATNLDALANIVLQRTPKGVVRLSDVAQTRSTFKRRTSLMHLNGIPGNALGVLRKTGSNVPITAAGLEKQIKALNRDFKQKEIPYQLKVLFTEVSYINQSISLVQSNLIMGSILAILVLLLFLGSPRSVFVIGLSIPVSLVAVFLVMRWLGRSLNIISLAGLAFAVGMVVDNAIVVLENIYRYIQLKRTSAEAAFEGTREVALAIAASTLTTVAVFLPIVFLKTEAGQIFKDIALAISAAVMFSLLVSLTIVPCLCNLVLKPEEPTGGIWAFRSFFENIGTHINNAYQYTLKALLDPNATARRLAFMLLVTALFVGGLAFLPPSEYLPTGNRNLILTLAKPLPGNNFDQVIDAAKPYEQYLLKRKEVERLFTVFGLRFNAIGAVLKPEYSDQESMQRILGEFRQKSSNVAGFTYMFPILASIFRVPGKQFEVEISGPDLGRLQAISKIIASQLQTTPGVIRVRSDFEEGAINVQVYPKRPALVEKGLAASDLGEAVQVALGGLRVGYYLDQGREVDLTLISSTKSFQGVDDLRHLPMITKDNKLIYLQSVAQIKEERAPVAINRLEMNRSITLTVNLGRKSAIGDVIKVVEEKILSPLRASVPSEYNLKLGETADRLNETLRDLIGSFLLAVLICYLLLVALFRSFLYPFIIMFTVPIAATGACFAVGVTGTSFDTITMLGFIILAGIVVNNAILLVSQSLELYRQGSTFGESLLEGSVSRLRPIMMTAITSIFGMLPLAYGGGAGSELYRGLGVAIVGGLTLSTFVTLYMTPVMMAMLEDFRGIFGKSRLRNEVQDLPPAPLA